VSLISVTVAARTRSRRLSVVATTTS